MLTIEVLVRMQLSSITIILFLGPMSIQAGGVEVTFGIVSCMKKSITLILAVRTLIFDNLITSHSSPNATDCYSFTAQDIPVCVGEIPDAFRVHVEAIDGYTVLPPHSFVATLKYTNETTILTFQAFDSDLPPNQLYNVVLEAENRAGGTNSTGIIQISELMHIHMS